MKTLGAFNILLILAVTVGCSDSPSENRAAASELRIGAIADDRIAGLGYVTPSRSGVTNADGEFDYRDGELVTFSLGPIALGASPGRPGIVVSELLGVRLEDDLTANPQAINLARLLQTIDRDGDPANGIQLPTSIPFSSLNFDQPLASFASDPEVLSGLEALGISQLVGAAQARDRLQATIDFVAETGSPNRSPTANAGGSLVLEEGQSAQVSAQNSRDLDGDVVSWRWRELTAVGLVITSSDSPVTRVTAPNVAGPAQAILELTVTDDQGATDSVSITVDVIDGAITPMPPNVDAGSDRVAAVGQRLDLSGQASDADGEVVSAVWRAPFHPDVRIEDAGSLNASVVAPDVTRDTDITLRLTVVDDDGYASSDDLIVRVAHPPANANARPNAYAGLNRSVDEGEVVVLDGRPSSDPDGDVVGFQWRNLSELAFTIANSNQAVAQFNAPQVEQSQGIDIELKVTDDEGASSVDIVTIVVRDVQNNALPVADAGDDQVVDADAQVILNGGGSSDPDGEVVSYRWRQTLGDDVVLSGAESSSASFVAPRRDQDTTLGFALDVTDNDGGADSDEMRVLVRSGSVNNNQGPIAKIAIAPNPAVPSGPVYLDGSGSSDPEGGTLSFAWTEAASSGCELAFMDPKAESTMTAAPADGSTVCTVQLTVLDPEGLSDVVQESFSVVVPSGTVGFEDCIENFADPEQCKQVCQELSGLGCDEDALIAALCAYDESGVASGLCAQSGDLDRDGVPDDKDECPATPPSAPILSDGCADFDEDGVAEESFDDRCPATPSGAAVNDDGCSDSQSPPDPSDLPSCTDSAACLAAFCGLDGADVLPLCDGTLPPPPCDDEFDCQLAFCETDGADELPVCTHFTVGIKNLEVSERDYGEILEWDGTRSTDSPAYAAASYKLTASSVLAQAIDANTLEFTFDYRFTGCTSNYQPRAVVTWVGAEAANETKRRQLRGAVKPGSLDTGWQQFSWVQKFADGEQEGYPYPGSATADPSALWDNLILPSDRLESIALILEAEVDNAPDCEMQLRNIQVMEGALHSAFAIDRSAASPDFGLSNGSLEGDAEKVSGSVEDARCRVAAEQCYFGDGWAAYYPGAAPNPSAGVGGSQAIDLSVPDQEKRAWSALGNITLGAKPSTKFASMQSFAFQYLAPGDAADYADLKLQMYVSLDEDGDRERDVCLVAVEQLSVKPSADYQPASFGPETTFGINADPGCAGPGSDIGQFLPLALMQAQFATYDIISVSLQSVKTSEGLSQRSLFVDDARLIPNVDTLNELEEESR